MVKSKNLVRSLVAFCCFSILSVAPTIAQESMWSKWLTFVNSPSERLLYIDCKLFDNVIDSFKISKSDRDKLVFSTLKNGNFIEQKDARFNDSNVGFQYEINRPLDLIGYFGWDSYVTRSILKQITEDGFDSQLKPEAVDTIKHHLKNVILDKDGERHIGLDLNEHIKLLGSISYSRLLDFRREGLYIISELKLSHPKVVDFKVLKPRNEAFSSANFNGYFGVVISEDDYPTGEKETKFLTCSAVY